MEMDRSGASTASFGNHKDLFVKQTRKGWCQELFGCEANTEFNIATKDDKAKDIYYATETTSCCIRFFCKGNRPFTIDVHEGNSTKGNKLLQYHRPFALPMGSGKCCCHQSVITKEVNGNVVGSTKEGCWCCIPFFNVHNGAGERQYVIHMPTCCFGMCVNICSEGCCSCKIPFGIYKPGQQKSDQKLGQITKVWGGLATEMFTDADKFEVEFPAEADADTKANLLGSVFLLNQLFFEGAPPAGAAAQ